MTNIWNQKEKPKRQPSCDEMNMGVGIIIGKFNRMESLLVDVISQDAKLNGENPRKFVEDWSRGSSKFYSIQRRYESLQILEGARCKSLDKIREGRNHIVHNYKGGVKEFGRLWDLNKEIDGMIGLLEHVIKNQSSKVRRMDNKARSTRTNTRRKSFDDCMSRCKRDRDGWAGLSELGIRLHESGVEYNGKLLDVCRELGFRTREKPGTDKKEAPIYQIK